MGHFRWLSKALHPECEPPDVETAEESAEIMRLLNEYMQHGADWCPEKQFEWAETMRKSFPLRDIGRISLVSIYLAAGHSEMAMQQLAIQLALDPDLPFPYRTLAKRMKQSGEDSRAIHQVLAKGWKQAEKLQKEPGHLPMDKEAWFDLDHKGSLTKDHA